MCDRALLTKHVLWITLEVLTDQQESTCYQFTPHIQDCKASFQSKLSFCFVPVPDFFEDGLPPPAQAYLKVCSAVSEASLNDVKPSSPPAILGSPAKEAVLPSSGITVQRRSVLHTEEIVRRSTNIEYQSTFSFLFICWVKITSCGRPIVVKLWRIKPSSLLFPFLWPAHMLS